jgi:hypothetical protein
MPTIRNISPIGALDVPLLRRIVGAGETVEVTDDQAERFLAQPANWELVATHLEEVADVPTDTVEVTA